MGNEELDLIIEMISLSSKQLLQKIIFPPNLNPNKDSLARDDA